MLSSNNPPIIKFLPSLLLCTRDDLDACFFSMRQSLKKVMGPIQCMKVENKLVP